MAVEAAGGDVDEVDATRDELAVRGSCESSTSQPPTPSIAGDADEQRLLLRPRGADGFGHLEGEAHAVFAAAAIAVGALCWRPSERNWLIR